MTGKDNFNGLSGRHTRLNLHFHDEFGKEENFLLFFFLFILCGTDLRLRLFDKNSSSAKKNEEEVEVLIEEKK